MSYFDPNFKVFTLNFGIDGIFGTGDDVILENPDYAPGSTAYFFVDDVEVGGTVEFHVQYSIDAGPDGVLGTADDTYVDSTEVDPDQVTWTVTDGERWSIDVGADGIADTGDDVYAGDLDGVANGEILASWYVDPSYLNDALRFSSRAGNRPIPQRRGPTISP